MAGENLTTASASVPDEVAQAIDAFGQGELSLLDVRQAVSLALEEHPARGEAIHELLDDELKARTLSIGDYGELVSIVGAVVSENVPTEWSEDAPENSGVYRVIDAGEMVPATGDEPALVEISIAAGEGLPEEDTPTRPFNAPLPDPVNALASEVAAGEILCDRFRLEEEIARGSVGVVFRATDLMKLEANAEDPLVAVKLVTAEFMNDKNALRAFQNEVANTQHLSHPNIVHLFELNRDGDRIFITMEWLEGESLAGLLDSSRGSALPPTQTYAIIEQLCDALIYAHEHNVVHADVKPGNVFLTETGEVKLIDFGIARLEVESGADTDAAQQDAIALTPAYASCERLEQADPTAQDDLFSLACLIYRLLAGRRVFGSLTALEAEEQAIEPVRIGGLSDERWSAVSQALAYRRADRQKSIVEFSEHFGRRSKSRDASDETSEPYENTTQLPILGAAAEGSAEPDYSADMSVDFRPDDDAEDFDGEAPALTEALEVALQDVWGEPPAKEHEQLEAADQSDGFADTDIFDADDISVDAAPGDTSDTDDSERGTAASQRPVLEEAAAKDRADRRQPLRLVAGLIAVSAVVAAVILLSGGNGDEFPAQTPTVAMAPAQSSTVGKIDRVQNGNVPGEPLSATAETTVLPGADIFTAPVFATQASVESVSNVESERQVIENIATSAPETKSAAELSTLVAPAALVVSASGNEVVKVAEVAAVVEVAEAAIAAIAVAAVANEVVEPVEPTVPSVVYEQPAAQPDDQSSVATGIAAIATAGVLADVEASQATPALAADSTLVAEIGPDAVGSGEALLVEESLVAQLPPEQSPSDASLAAEASFSAVNRQIDIAAALGMAVPADEPVAAAEIGPQFVFNARQSVPLSELEFTKYVEPKYPRDRQRQSIRTRPYNGWMDKYPRGGQGQSIRNQVYNGWVDVEFRVGTDGRPRNVEIIGSDLPTRFESPSLTAVNKWRFKPYEHDGEAVAVYSAARLRFEN